MEDASPARFQTEQEPSPSGRFSSVEPAPLSEAHCLVVDPECESPRPRACPISTVPIDHKDRLFGLGSVNDQDRIAGRRPHDDSLVFLAAISADNETAE